MLDVSQRHLFLPLRHHAGHGGTTSRPWQTAFVVLALLAVCGATSESQVSGATGSRPSPLVGTLGASAAAALGRPWTSATPQPPARQVGRGHMSGHVRGGLIPLRVIDAPLASRGGGAVVTYASEPPARIVPPVAQWYPTMRPPRWQVVEEEHPAQGWRVVDVEDLLCNAAGSCTMVTNRILARWAPPLRSYAFVDRVGRVWIVE